METNNQHDIKNEKGIFMETNNQPKKHSKSFFVAIGWAAATVLCCVFIAIVIVIGIMFLDKNETTAEFGQRQVGIINRDLAKDSSNVRKRIESAHGTVTVSSISVTKYNVITLDGSDNAGEDGSNVSKLQIWITAHWDGIVHKDGHTVLYINIDAQNKRLLESRIVETDAMINMEDPKFWYNVGTCVGLLLL